MAGKAGQTESLIVALASGKSNAQAAREAGCSVRTVQRRLSDPEFSRRVSEARGEMFGRAVGMLADATASAVETLKGLLKAQSETIQLGAARCILEMGPKLRESTELAERISALESKIGEDQL
jgi:hypothetical protein